MTEWGAFGAQMRPRKRRPSARVERGFTPFAFKWRLVDHALPRLPWLAPRRTMPGSQRAINRRDCQSRQKTRHP
jgi:hypothetical protein